MHEQSSGINNNRVAARSEMYMSSKPLRNANTTTIERGAGEISFQDLFDKQKAYFATDVTKTYE